MSPMEPKTGRLKTLAIVLGLFVVVAGATAFIATEWGTNRALTLLVALALVAGLVWLVLSIGLLVAGTGVRRERAGDTA